MKTINTMSLDEWKKALRADTKATNPHAAAKKWGIGVNTLKGIIGGALGATAFERWKGRQK